MSKYLAKMPIALSGVALGTAGITGAWTTVTGNPLIGIVGASIASCLVIPVILKYILHPKLFWEEISHPTLGSVIPTLDMALMLISGVIVQYNVTLGRGIWGIAIILHAIFFTKFFQYRIKDFDLNHVLPSWFIPPIGIVVACVSGAEMRFNSITEVCFYIGLVSFMIMFPIVLYRIFFGDKIEDARLPSFGVLGAPANLCLAGYLTSFSTPDYYLATGLAHFGVFTTLIVYITMVRVFIKIKFIPLYAAYTFPLGIGATAMIKYTNFLKNTSTPIHAIQIWDSIATIELIIASLVIFYVFVNLILFVWKNIKQ